MKILTGDIGGTHARLALVENRGREYRVLLQKDFPSAQYDGLGPIVQAFLQQNDIKEKPARACFAVAGPVREGKVKLTNLPWELDSVALAESLGIDGVTLINDFESIGYGVAHLEAHDFKTLQAGDGEKHGNCVVLGAGTGLGQCLMTWCNGRYYVHATEGGHADFAARNDGEIALLQFLLQKKQRVSYEDLLSGNGLAAIYEHLAANAPGSQGLPVQATDTAAAISEQAKQGNAIAQSTMTFFMSIYGAHAGDLALAERATGGVFIAGGIAGKNLEFLENGEFMRAFVQKPPMIALLERIPVKLILSTDVGLIGAAACVGPGD